MLSSTPLQIKNNPSNTSSSKQQWSFSKSRRFPLSKSKYLHNLIAVAANHSISIDHSYLIENHHLALAQEVNTLMEINKYLNLESINCLLILMGRKKEKDLASQQIVKIYALTII